MAKRKRPRTEEDVFYALKITSWDWSYSFQVGDQKWYPEEAFTDYRHLTVSGTLSHPFGLAGQHAVFSFVPSDDLLGKTAHRYTRRPESIGHINRDKQTGVFSSIFSMPADVLPTLLPMLTARRLLFVVLQGNKLRYGRTLIRSYRFSGTLSEDDFPAGQWQQSS